MLINKKDSTAVQSNQPKFIILFIAVEYNDEALNVLL